MRTALVATLALSACAAMPRRVSMTPAGPVPAGWTLYAPGAQPIPAAMQYLYGSGEAATLSLQAWRALVSYAAMQVRARPTESVVLDEDATLANPRSVPCGAKPLAAVFDVDETVLLNLGFESDDATHPGRPYDEARWQAWERTGADKVSAGPGAAKALGVLRQMGVTVVFNTNRSLANVDRTRAAIEGAGLGPAVHGDTLYVSGDDATGSHKDGRRRMITARYCVIALAGDQLGDFSDLFNAISAPAARRAATLEPPISTKWGAGWFVLPNPVYGSGLKGGLDDVFPADKRWTLPTSSEK